MNRALRLTAFPIAALVILAGLLAVGRGAQPERVYKGVSQPSQIRELAFAVRGKIAEVNVEPGDRVSAGQELVRLDDAVQRAMVELAEAQGQDDSRLELARITVDFRTEELALVEKSQADGGANEQDVRSARFELARTKVELRAAESEMVQRALTVQRERARLDEMRLLSTIEGDVIKVSRREGETVDEQTPVVTVVQVEPLRIDVSVPVSVSRDLRPGREARVRWLDVQTEEPLTGRVIFVSRAGEGSVREVLVRVEVPNAEGLPSGMHAEVSFSALP